MKKPTGNFRTYGGSIFLIVTALKSFGVDLQISEADIDVILQAISGAALAWGVMVNLFKRMKYYIGGI